MPPGRHCFNVSDRFAIVLQPLIPRLLGWGQGWPSICGGGRGEYWHFNLPDLLNSRIQTPRAFPVSVQCRASVSDAGPALDCRWAGVFPWQSLTRRVTQSRFDEIKSAPLDQWSDQLADCPIKCRLRRRRRRRRQTVWGQTLHTSTSSPPPPDRPSAAPGAVQAWIHLPPGLIFGATCC